MLRLNTLTATLFLIFLALHPIWISEAQNVSLIVYLEEPEVNSIQYVYLVNETLYAAGSKGPYLIVLAYRGVERLWAQSVNLEGNVSVLNMEVKRGLINIIASSRSFNNNTLWTVKLDTNGSIVEKTQIKINLRLDPLKAIALGDAIYIAGSSLILGVENHYMVARVSSKGVEWVREDLDLGYFKCLNEVAGGRLLAVGDNGTTGLIVILSQTGEVLRSYSISFNETSLRILGCTRAAGREYYITGSAGALPTLIRLTIGGNLEISVNFTIVGGIRGVGTSIAQIGDYILVNTITQNGTLILIFNTSSNLKLIGYYNVTRVTGVNPIALEASTFNNRVAYGGFHSRSGYILILELSPPRIDAIAPIGILTLIGDPRFTIALIIAIVALLAIAVYTRVARKKQTPNQTQ